MPTDVPFRIGPIQPYTAPDGTIWTADGNVSPIIFRTLKIVNTSPNRDAWFSCGTSDKNTANQNMIKDLYCPAGTTQLLHVDWTWPDSALDTFFAQQVVDQELGSLTVSQAVAAVASSTDATSYVTGSYTMTAGELYVAAIHIKAQAGSMTLTGTHTGEAWTLLSTSGVNGGVDRVKVYAHLATATSSGTTTFGSSVNLGGCIIQIVRVQGLPNTDVPVAWDDVLIFAGDRAENRVAKTQHVMDAWGMSGSRLYVCQNQSVSSFSFEKEYIEVFDNNIADGLTGAVAWARRAGTCGFGLNGALPSGTAENTDRVGVMLDIHDTSQVLQLTIDGVQVLD